MASPAPNPSTSAVIEALARRVEALEASQTPEALAQTLKSVRGPSAPSFPRVKDHNGVTLPYQPVISVGANMTATNQRTGPQGGTGHIELAATGGGTAAHEFGVNEPWPYAPDSDVPFAINTAHIAGGPAGIYEAEILLANFGADSATPNPPLAGLVLGVYHGSDVADAELTAVDSTGTNQATLDLHAATGGAASATLSVGSAGVGDARVATLLDAVTEHSSWVKVGGKFAGAAADVRVTSTGVLFTSAGLAPLATESLGTVDPADAGAWSAASLIGAVNWVSGGSASDIAQITWGQQDHGSGTGVEFFAHNASANTIVYQFVGALLTIV